MKSFPGQMASKVLVVNHRDPEEVRVAVAGNGCLQDLRWARGGEASKVGNLYLGEVRQVEPGLDAAFIDFGDRRAGFLHVGNLHPGYAEDGVDPFTVAGSTVGDLSLDPDGLETQAGFAKSNSDAAAKKNIGDILRPGQKLVVQVLRDAVRGKGATLTTLVSLAGRLLVLMPTLAKVGVSRRIEDGAERKRLRQLVRACSVPDDLGFITRTAAVGCELEELQRDMEHLVARWQAVGKAIADAKAPALLLAEESAVVRAVRDLYTTDLEQVWVDHPQAHQEVERFLHEYAPQSSLQVQAYEKSRPIFEAFDLERDYQVLLRNRVPVGHGASVVIHETEALTAIDVNSGRIDKGSLEETALEANLLAAEEVARQIRLRDLGGILVVDFIDLQQGPNRKAVEVAFKKALRRDRARLKVGRLGAFGLMALTRRRQGTGLPRATESPCPCCSGSGSRQAHWGGAMRALRKLRSSQGAVRLRAHPEVVESLQQLHGEVLQALDLEIEVRPDAQISPGDPVVEKSASS
ncbi:MAG: ribonuclease E [Planctomycetota bacterium]|nr:MAG: ribonuclease E [Planctomycetota bacterium]